MKVLISSCLLGENCKYNGKNNYSPRVLKLLEGCELVGVCPEILAGMPSPRPPVELKNGRAADVFGKDVHDAYCEGVRLALETALKESVCCAVLQPRSPTCGVTQIYDGTFTGALIAGQGLFARALSAAGIPVYDADSISDIPELHAKD
ncbi:MAG: DUF523 domain-containing protein [Pyramidobacter sp.]|nr:DUF523 domain-containing protein [Pyramidobacter sp.]